MIVSLDGYIEDPQRSLDWLLDGDPQFEQYCAEMIDSVGLAVYGRGSYELMVSYWPRAETQPGTPRDHAFARKMNTLPEIVLSRTLGEPTWATVARDVEQIAALKRTEGKPIVAWAGAGLVASLARAGLIDEYRLIIHPIVLGGGTPMWSRGAQASATLGRAAPQVDVRQALRLTRTTQLGGSLVMLCYAPVKA